jgi:hypothetical protein
VRCERRLEEENFQLAASYSGESIFSFQTETDALAMVNVLHLQAENPIRAESSSLASPLLIASAEVYK